MTLADRYEAPVDYIRQRGHPATAFSQETIMDNKELWVMRVPDNVSTKDLDGLTIKCPQSTASGIVLSEAKINSRSYQIITPRAADVSAEFRGMAELSVLVPDGDNEDKLTLVPTRFSQTLALVENIEIPQSVDVAAAIAERVKPPRAQPDNMQLRFIPYGFYSADEYRMMITADGQNGGESVTPKRAAEDNDDAAMEGLPEDKSDGAEHKKSKKEKKDKKEKSKKSKE
ncbi:hypothetical protein LPJ64_004943 [Coemansia asiatica]|uniref:Uncharacterized protein n=1 Tax=Coemansia asiatica TaxID=1052880 RepID=A0A9W7XHC7_9FUNG|nr:hypothetical protein LPJ64_004943 [Coemansia asiatica]